MKRSIKMIALLLALALMAGGTLLAQKMTETRSVSETEGTFALAAQTAEEVTGLSWTHEGVTYHFVKQDGAWKNADDAAFPVNSDEVQELADRLLKPSEEFVPAPFLCEEPATVAQEYVETAMPVASPLFYIGFKEPNPVHTPETLAASRVLVELVAGKSSPLYTRLMDEGLINDQFEAEYFGGPGYGVWLLGGESADPKRVLAIAKEEIARLQAEGIDPAAAEAVRRGAYGRLVAGLDDPTDCAELILGNLTDGIPPLAELDALADLTVEQLQQQLCSRIPVDAGVLSVVNPL